MRRCDPVGQGWKTAQQAEHTDDPGAMFPVSRFGGVSDYTVMMLHLHVHEMLESYWHQQRRVLSSQSGAC